MRSSGSASALRPFSASARLSAAADSRSRTIRHFHSGKSRGVNATFVKPAQGGGGEGRAQRFLARLGGQIPACFSARIGRVPFSSRLARECSDQLSVEAVELTVGEDGD